MKSDHIQAIWPPQHHTVFIPFSILEARVLNEDSSNQGLDCAFDPSFYAQNGHAQLIIRIVIYVLASKTCKTLKGDGAKPGSSPKGYINLFSSAQDKATAAENDTKDHVRKAYNTFILLTGPKARESFELSYVPPSKKVLEQAEEELLSKDKLHREFNPALFNTRWASLWPKTATVITTMALWEKFTRQGQSPILTSIKVLQETIRQGVERELFGYGVLHDSDQDKLQANSYERMYLGPFDARELDAVEVSQRTLLMRPVQVDVLFPPITKEEIAMILVGPRQSVETVFWAARRSLTVQGRVDKNAFFTAICRGVKAGLFGYADASDAPVVRGSDAELTPSQVKFSGWLIGEEVPLPVTANEIADLVPAEGRIVVQELYQVAMSTYGVERVSEQSLFNALYRCLAESRFGYAANEDDIIQTEVQAVGMDGYIGQPEPLPPDTRVIRFTKRDASPVELANVMKATTNLSKLGESSISLDLRLELKGEVNEHAVAMALNELRSRVLGLKVEDVKGKE